MSAPRRGLRRRLATGTNALIVAVIVVIVIVLAVDLAGWFRVGLDLTAEGASTLEPGTVSALADADRSGKAIEVIHFKSRIIPKRPMEAGHKDRVVRDFLIELERSASNVSTAQLDLNADREKALELGVRQAGTVVVHAAGDRVDIKDRDLFRRSRTGDANNLEFRGEGEIARAIKLVTAGDPKKVYLLKGHGELRANDPGRTGLQRAAELMDQEGWEVDDLDFLQAWGEEVVAVPDDADAVLIVGPTANLTAEGDEALRSYFVNGGSIGVFLEPGGKVPDLVGEVGISRPDGWVYADKRVGASTRRPLVPYKRHAITTELLEDDIWTLVENAAPLRGEDWKGLRIEPLMQVNRNGWNRAGRRRGRLRRWHRRARSRRRRAGGHRVARAPAQAPVRRPAADHRRRRHGRHLPARERSRERDVSRQRRAVAPRPGRPHGQGRKDPAPASGGDGRHVGADRPVGAHRRAAAGGDLPRRVGMGDAEEAMNRFKGSLLALIVLAVIGGAWALVVALTPDPPDVSEVEIPQLFSFEKEELVGIEVVRSDATIELVREEGVWRVVGDDWRPSRSMTRRVAHQLHNLTARDKVVDQVEDPSKFGLGADQIEVTLTLSDGRTLQFLAGDPNPEGVSFYIRPLPGEAVYIVKKAAVDYYSLRLEEFRERRFASLRADDADAIHATVDGRTLRFHRTGPKKWAMDEPMPWQASREKVRTMLGRTGALKAKEFAADAPTDKAKFGLEPPRHTVEIGVSEGETITLHVGDDVEVEGDSREHAYVYRVEDDAVYVARRGFLEAFREELEDYRNRDILGKNEWDVTAYEVTRDGQTLKIERAAGGWLWPDGSLVSGSTPKRVAGSAAGFKTLSFHDEAPPASETGLDAPTITMALTFEEGEPATVKIGKELRIPIEPDPEEAVPPPPLRPPGPPGMEPELPERPAKTEEVRYWVEVEGDPVIYQIDEALVDRVGDLFREHKRKVERDAEKAIREELDDEDGEEPAGEAGD